MYSVSCLFINKEVLGNGATAKLELHCTMLNSNLTKHEDVKEDDITAWRTGEGRTSI